MYKRRTPGAKRDPEKQWALPDRVFFAAGACHILAHVSRTVLPIAVGLKREPLGWSSQQRQAENVLYETAGASNRLSPIQDSYQCVGYGLSPVVRII
jgi:hypothetical protein